MTIMRQVLTRNVQKIGAASKVVILSILVLNNINCTPQDVGLVLTFFKPETPKWVFLQIMKTQMKCHTRRQGLYCLLRQNRISETEN